MTSLMEPLVFLAGVVMGTGSTITVKVMYGLESVGVDGAVHKFEKPLFTTWIMFIAMTIALPIHYVVQWRQQTAAADYEMRRQKGLRATANGSDYALNSTPITAPTPVPWRTFVLLVIPATFDLFGTALASIGLLFTTVSVYQLVRCSVIIVTAVLKATLLKQRLTSFMWIGILINTVAMVLVSATSFMPGASAGALTEDYEVERDPRWGIFFILCSCLVQGSQYVFEERVMTIDNAPPLVVVGMEGFWGALLMPLIVFPWAYILPGTDVGGCMENFYDSFVLITNSVPIQIILLVFTVTVCLYNIFCIYVTFLLNSIWHAILDNFRPISVWATDLALFYLFTDGRFGEEWTAYSWLELIGMFLLFYGTAVYNGSTQLPFVDYSDELDERSELDVNGTPVAAYLSSPMLTRSPLVNKQLIHQRDLNAEFGGPLSANHARTSNDAYYGSQDAADARPLVNPSSRRTNQTKRSMSVERR